MGPGITSNLHDEIVNNRRVFCHAEIQLTCAVPSTERTVSVSGLTLFLCAYLLKLGHCPLECQTRPGECGESPE